MSRPTTFGGTRRGALLLTVLFLLLAQPGLAWVSARLNAVCGAPGAACCCAADEPIEVEPSSCCESEASLGAPRERADAAGCACELTPLPEAPSFVLVERSRGTLEDARAAVLLSSRTVDLNHCEARELPAHDPPRWGPARGVLARRGVIAFLAVLSVARI